MRELRELILLTQLCATPPSMKGEITRSKRHLKGHRSKLSFSRLADPRVTSRLFPRSIVFPRCVLWPTIRLLIASTNLEENRETLANTDFFGHQSTLPKKPQTTSSVLSPRAGSRRGKDRTSQREFSRSREGDERKWKAPSPAFLSLSL